MSDDDTDTLFNHLHNNDDVNDEDDDDARSEEENNEEEEEKEETMIEEGGGGNHLLPLFRHFSISVDDESSPLLMGSFSKSKKKRSSSSLSKSMGCKCPFLPKNKSIWWLCQFWTWYGRMLNQRPLLTKALTSGFLTLCSDIVGQYMEGMPHDYIRSIRFATMGCFLQAPVTHYYYVALDKYLPPTSYPWTKTTLLKLMIDQLIYAPTFILLVTLYLGAASGSSWDEIVETKIMKDNLFFHTVVNNWKLWVPAGVINMAYVPPIFRVLYCNVVFFGWSIYLSIKLNR